MKVVLKFCIIKLLIDIKTQKYQKKEKIMSIFLYFVQIVGIVVLLVGMAYVGFQRPTKLQQSLLAMLATCLLDHVGYLLLMTASSYSEGMVALKMLYLGKAFVPLATLMFTLENYRIKIKRWIFGVLFLLHFAVLMLIMTCEYQSIYYTSIEFSTAGLCSSFKLGHGLVYNLYNYGVVLIYLVVMLAASIIKHKEAKLKIEKKRITCIVWISIISILGMLLLLTGWFPGYDTTEFAYLISASILLVCIVKFNILDPLSAAKDTVLDESEDAMLVTDAKDNIIYINPKGIDIYKKSAITDYAELKKYMYNLAAENRLYEQDNCFYKFTVKDIIKDGDLYGKIYYLIDVSTEYLALQDAEKQKQISENANAAKSNFLARISHEIRTPMNAILGMNEMVLRESTEAVVKDYAMNIKASSKFLLSIINDILDFSKIESGKMEIIPTQYELSGFINNIYQLLADKAKGKDLDLQVEVDEGLPNVLYGDDVRIRQVLLNLLNNAIKYTQKGFVKLKVTGIKEEDNVILNFLVEDSGIGIKQEDMPKLFATYERIEEGRNRNIEGTGLGMNIVKNLLLLMDSDIIVQSEYGKGSRFSFDLKQKIIKDEPVGNIVERINNNTQEYTYTALFEAKDTEVLIVDDNEINRFVFECLLKETKIKIVQADSGDEALKLTKEQRFDVIFMDHMMPEMDGITAFHEIQKQEGGLNKDTPVIILTANAVEGAKDFYMKEGFSDYMTKPFEPEIIEAKLKDILPEEKIKV